MRGRGHGVTRPGGSATQRVPSGRMPSAKAGRMLLISQWLACGRKVFVSRLGCLFCTRYPCPRASYWASCVQETIIFSTVIITYIEFI